MRESEKSVKEKLRFELLILGRDPALFQVNGLTARYTNEDDQ